MGVMIGGLSPICHVLIVAHVLLLSMKSNKTRAGLVGWSCEPEAFIGAAARNFLPVETGQAQSHCWAPSVYPFLSFSLHFPRAGPQSTSQSSWLPRG